MVSRHKKLFLVFSFIFIVLLLLASYDIATRTTFPGSKPHLKHRLIEDKERGKSNEIIQDTVRSNPDSVFLRTED